MNPEEEKEAKEFLEREEKIRNYLFDIISDKDWNDPLALILALHRIGANAATHHNVSRDLFIEMANDAYSDLVNIHVHEHGGEDN